MAMDLDELLNGVKNGTISVDKAKAELKAAPFIDLDYAKLDMHRRIRTGMAEVVFCQGKEDAFLMKIIGKFLENDGEVFGTRCSKEQAQMLQKSMPMLQYDPVSRIISYQKPRELKGHIAVVTAGTADIKVAEEAARTCEYFGGKVSRIYDAGVSGLHRLLSNLDPIQNANCVIAVAGMEGALASVIGGLVSNPVIAVPTSVGYGANFHGLSAHLSMINSCSNGVATVNIDNGFGAGFIATQINRLAVSACKEPNFN